MKKPILENCTYVNWLEYPGYIMMHRHDNLAEVTLIVHGKGRYAVNNHLYDVKVGDVILSGAGVVHDAFMQEREHYGTLTIQLSGLQMPGCEPGQFLEEDQVPVFHLPKQYPELRRQMSEIQVMFGREDEKYQEACQERIAAAALRLQEIHFQGQYRGSEHWNVLIRTQIRLSRRSLILTA